MKVTIQTKLLTMCILLVLMATVSISTAYYVLATGYMHRESRQRIQIAFDIILDDFADRLDSYTNRVAEFLITNDLLQATISSYQQDKSRISSISFISNNLAKTAEELKRFAHVNFAQRVTLYGADKRLLTVYQYNDEQENIGVYVTLQGENDTYIPLADSAELTSVLLGREAIPDTALPPGVATNYQEDIPRVLSTNLFTEGNTMGIRITAPIYDQETLTGILISDITYTQSMMERYASLSKTEISLFVGNQLSVGTLPAHMELGPDVKEELLSCQDLLDGNKEIQMLSTTIDNQEYYQAQCGFRNTRDTTIGAISASLSQNVEKEEISKILKTMLTISIITIGIAFVLSMLFSRKTVRAIQNIVRVISAASEGDLRPIAIAVTHDEIGILARRSNRMISHLRTLSGQIQEASYTVNATADTVLRQVETLIGYMEQQSSSVDNTTDSVEKINQFIDAASRNTTDLLIAAAQILASIQETRENIDEVTTSTGSLSNNLQLISSSVDQVNQTVKQISENTGQLAGLAQQTETEVHHIDQSLRDVSHNADRAQQLAKETMDAVTSGQASVDASIQGMKELKDTVSNTTQIIREVNSWGGQVSAILDIVDEITEQTSLLALNASIISAQAGMHGRGFGVVADEIKELATRTKTSTKEIGTLVRKLQMKTEEGVRHTKEGLQKADQEMQLANAVKDALTTILERATRSSSRAADIARVIQQTADSSQIISASMKSVTDMVSNIQMGIQEQEQDIEKVVSAVENISGMAEQVNHASVEQKRAAEGIERNMTQVTEKFSDISDQTEELKQNSAQIVSAMHTIESTTEQILQNATDISGDTVKNLVQQSDVLQKIVNVFKL